MPGVGINTDFVMAAAEILHERVPDTDHSHRLELLQAPHRPQPGLQAPVSGFDGVISRNAPQHDTQRAPAHRPLALHELPPQRRSC